jgi:glycosyltransferase involved in cell wall biosynthesis
VDPTPKVSVVITCHNLGPYLEEAVDSVLAQTCQDFEIVIVDDGSTDRATQTLLDGFDRPKTRVMRLPHGGLAAARNAGIASTTGQYLCALDGDDRLTSSFLSKTVSVLDSDPSVTFASSWLRTFGDEEWEWKPERCDLPMLLSEDTVLTAALVRREAVAAVGGYDAAMPVQGDEDWDLWLTLVERGHRGVILPEILFEYRRRAGSMSSVCWHGPGHLPLAGYRIRKHREAYRDNLFDVLLRQDANTATLLHQNDALEREIAELDPAVALRRQELGALQRRLAVLDSSNDGSGDVTPEALNERVRDLEAALTATAAEVRALRSSMSWSVTAPLRHAYGWLLRWRGSR